MVWWASGTFHAFKAELLKAWASHTRAADKDHARRAKPVRKAWGGHSALRSFRFIFLLKMELYVVHFPYTNPFTGETLTGALISSMESSPLVTNFALSESLEQMF